MKIVKELGLEKTATRNEITSRRDNAANSWARRRSPMSVTEGCALVSRSHKRLSQFVSELQDCLSVEYF